MKNPAGTIRQNEKRYIEELFDLLRIPSISLATKHRKNMHITAGLLRERLELAGADNAQVCKTGGHPIVYAEKIIDPDLPTVMVYGHYDVQPPDPLSEWQTPPFKPVIRDEKIYARGASDNKGQVFMHIKAFEIMQVNKSLPCNIKFLIEGEEEMGSPNLAPFCKKNIKKLACDVILVSDTTMVDEQTPAITTGLRGLSYLEVEVTGPDRDLHSGLYGGAVLNPINALAKMLTTVIFENYHIAIPGFYDDVVDLSRKEREELARAHFEPKLFRKSIGIDREAGETSFTTPERIGIRPSFDVNGIWGGHIEEGAKTIIPAKAHAKISARLVPNQDPDTIAGLIVDHLKTVTPKGVKVKIKTLHGAKPYITPTDSIEYKAAQAALAKTFRTNAVQIRSGGSIPIIPLFEEILGAKSVLMGFGLDSDAIHSPNENFALARFFKGIETIPYFFEKFTKLKTESAPGTKK